MESVAVYSEADRDAPWLRHATRTICIGPARADRSYLDADAVLQAAEQTECQAIHPGYGFLSENARFAARCEQQGITFVGPGAGAIRRMGDKLEAKRTMAAAGLPVIPGPLEPLASAEEAVSVAAGIGYPVLLKASAGGGGKGMRRCDDASGVVRGFAEASREAEKAFGDPSLYLEKLLVGGRHVEFQIVADAHGAAVHLGERECSIQRNHQKLLEESPCPVLSPADRDEIGSRVAAAVAAIGYRNAGTVEFLRDASGRLHFMEMNTRLQVEHPVTEAVTGLDLVVEQFRVAALHPLSCAQERIRVAGHAIEFRINAEDPESGFRPDPGTIRRFVPPSISRPGCSVRWDSAIEEGYRIPPHYDSLIGKLIVHGPDRDEALEAAAEALGALRIEGVATTIPLHLGILDDPAFRSGSYDIGFLAARAAARAGG
jgi:acetyl-CoA carboxylase biotin carboxylase subunit